MIVLPAFLRPRRFDRDADRFGVVTVDVRHDVPAVRLEALRRVVREPALHLAVDRDAVVVVEADQLAEPLRARERARLVRDAFHQAAVAAEEIGVVVDDGRVRAIEVRREEALRERHPDRIRDALAERPRGRLDADVDLALGMARAARAELAKMLDLVDPELVAREIRNGIEQHRAVAVREHEPVAVVPMRLGRREAQVIAPENLGDVGHAHRHAGVA